MLKILAACAIGLASTIMVSLEPVEAGHITYSTADYSFVVQDSGLDDGIWYYSVGDWYGEMQGTAFVSENLSTGAQCYGNLYAEFPTPGTARITYFFDEDSNLFGCPYAGDIQSYLLYLEL